MRKQFDIYIPEELTEIICHFFQTLNHSYNQHIRHKEPNNTEYAFQHIYKIIIELIRWCEVWK